MNHPQMCLMASTFTWIYADRLKADPQHRHKVEDRASFAFSNMRGLIAEVAIGRNFDNSPLAAQSTQNPLVTVLMRMVARVISETSGYLIR